MRVGTVPQKIILYAIAIGRASGKNGFVLLAVKGTDTASKIEAYGLIGNTYTSALVPAAAPSTGYARPDSIRTPASRPSWVTTNTAAGPYVPRSASARTANAIATTQ